MNTELPAPEPLAGDAAPDRHVALVLGAGGARGLAHIGVLEVLAERGYQVSSLVGSSMGALVAGVFAAGHLATYREWACALDRRGVFQLVDLAFRRPGLIKGVRVISALRALVGDHLIEELPLPYTAVATDLDNQRQVWITHGRLFDAIRASIAIPLLLTPHPVNGRMLVDGSLLAPVPIAATRHRFADLMIAVDVNARPRHLRPERPVSEDDLANVPTAPPGGMRARMAALLPGRDRGAPAPKAPGMVRQMSRALDTMQGQLSRLQLAMDPPDILVKVPRDACEFFEFWRAEEMIGIGREATKRALDAWEDV